MKLKYQALLEVLLQTDLMTWHRSVKLLPRRDCNHLLFKHVALDSLGYLYLYNFNGFFEQFYSLAS